MNLPIAILLLCAMLGLVDKILGNRMGLGEEFDRGLTMMGSLALTMSGIYCFSVMLGRWLAVWLQGEQRLFLARDRIGVKPLF